MKNEQKHTAPKKKYGMAIDLDKCTGCGMCVHACPAKDMTEQPSFLPESSAWPP